MANFGELLKRYRREAGFTQEYLAERALLSATAIGMLERGLHRAPRRETVALLAKALVLSEAQQLELETAANANRARVASSSDDDLPVSPSSFVGRGNEMATLRGIVLAGTHRLVTITGPGGVGKSRLALEAARLIADDFGDGVRLVPLASVTDPQFVDLAILNALGEPDRGDRSPSELLRHALRRRNVLLVLDNCEHLLNGVAAAAASILTTCPQTRLLATSRERLRVAGELTFDLSSLSYPIAAPQTPAEAIEYSALQLFADRATSLSAQPFEIDEDNLGPVTEIVRRLDGLPLAIELAAPILRVLSIAELARRLEDRFQLLATGERDALPHHRSLLAMIDWSSERLTESERLLFRRCSCFNGSFSLDAAIAVCGTAPLQQTDILPLLSALIEKSLIHVADKADGRYDLLDVVRGYAKNLVDDPTESRELSHRHAEYYFTIARETNPWAQQTNPWVPEQSVAESSLRRLKPDIGNVEAALTWTLLERGDPTLGAELAIALNWSSFSLESYLRSRYWLDRTVEVLDASVSPDLSARLAFKLLYFYQMDDELTKYIPNLEQAVAYYRRIDDPKGLVRALGSLALAQATANEAERARRSAAEGVAVARNSSSYDLVRALHKHAIVEEDVETQRALLMECLDLCRQDGIQADTILSALGQVAFSAGDVDGALAWTRNALDSLRSSRTTTALSAAFHLSNLAGYLLTRGEVDDAIPVAQEALELKLQMGYPYFVATSIQHLATASLLRGNATRAALLLGFVEARTRSASRVALRLELRFRAKLTEMLASALSETERELLGRTGGNWTEERAVEEARLVV